MNGKSAVAAAGNAASVTLVQIERALCYWRREALRDLYSEAPAAGLFLQALEQQYRRLVVARCGAVPLAQLSQRERNALHLWWRTLRDEE
jgi:hypothetical protein